jgi:hypothetical protein
MPDEWQDKMAELLEQWDETWDWSDCGFDYTTIVARKNNRFVKIRDVFTKYRHIDLREIEKYKRGL